MGNFFDLTGKVAVVTGSSSGLGADAALAYAQAGADVALLARRVEKLELVKAEIEKTGRKVIAVGCDVTKEESVKSAIETTLGYGIAYCCAYFIGSFSIRFFGCDGWLVRCCSVGGASNCQ